MSIKTLIQEAINKNALGFEAALKEALKSRMILALEAKVKLKPEEESDDAVKESLANWKVGIISVPSTGPFKLKKIVATSPRGKTYTFDNEAEAAQHHGKDAWEKMKNGVGGWKVDLNNKKPYLESYELVESKSLHDYDWPRSALHPGSSLGDHAHDAIRHGMHVYDAMDHLFSVSDNEGRKWLNSNRDDLVNTFRSYGLKTEEVQQIDEVSKKTLGSYIKKARRSSDKARDIEDRAYEKANWERNPRRADRLYNLASKASKTVDKREKGIDKAINKLSEAFLNEAAHVWYDVSHWGGDDDSRFKPLDKAQEKGVDIAHAATHKQYSHLPDHFIGVPMDNKALISHMDKHARLADVDRVGKETSSAKKLSPAVKFGDYELTVGPTKSRKEAGDIVKAFAHVRNMEKLGVPHMEKDDYGDTVAVEVHNTKTGDTTRHHVYQAGMSSRPDERHLRSVSVRSVGTVGPSNTHHAEVIKKFLEQKK